MLKNLYINDSVTNQVFFHLKYSVRIIIIFTTRLISFTFTQSSKILYMLYSFFSDLVRVGVAFSGSLLSPTCVACTVEVSSSTLASQSTVSPLTLPTAAVYFQSFFSLECAYFLEAFVSYQSNLSFSHL